MSVLDALLDSPLREVFDESKRRRRPKGAKGGGEFSTGGSDAATGGGYGAPPRRGGSAGPMPKQSVPNDFEFKVGDYTYKGAEGFYISKINRKLSPRQLALGKANPKDRKIGDFGPNPYNPANRARLRSKLGLAEAEVREAFSSATSPGMSSPNPSRDAQRRLTPAQRKTYRANSGGSGGSGGFNSKHPRGRAGTSQGGKFIAAGSSGESVRAVQAKVGVKQDGKFGNQTHNAVRDFQRRHGLVVDGVVGHQTALAMSGKYSAARRAQTGALRQSDRSALGRVRASVKAGRKATAPTRRRGGVVV